MPALTRRAWAQAVKDAIPKEPDVTKLWIVLSQADEHDIQATIPYFPSFPSSPSSLS